MFFDASNAARVIPYRGSWLDVEFDAKKTFFLELIEEKNYPWHFCLNLWDWTMKKHYQGFTIQLNLFSKKDKQVNINYDFNELKGELNFDLINADNNEVLLSKGDRLTNRHNREFEEKKLKIY